MTRAELSRAEVIGLRLYTGPLFVLYNAVLRGFPDKDVALLLDKEGRENRYETTIFVIASGVTKLSKITDIPPDRKVYRGLGGMILPRQFWECFPECQITFEVASEGPMAESIIKKIKESIYIPVSAQAAKSEERVASEVSVEYLRVNKVSWTLFLASLKEDIPDRLARAVQEILSRGARVVKGAKVAGRGVRMSVALPVRKHVFEQLKGDFEQAVKALCSGGHDVTILEVADKPGDFRGGGALMLC